MDGLGKTEYRKARDREARERIARALFLLIVLSLWLFFSPVLAFTYTLV